MNLQSIALSPVTKQSVLNLKPGDFICVSKDLDQLAVVTGIVYFCPLNSNLPVPSEVGLKILRGTSPVSNTTKNIRFHIDLLLKIDCYHINPDQLLQIYPEILL